MDCDGDGIIECFTIDASGYDGNVVVTRRNVPFAQ
jgi:hypothetical protein